MTAVFMRLPRTFQVLAMTVGVEKRLVMTLEVSATVKNTGKTKRIVKIKDKK